MSAPQGRHETNEQYRARLAGKPAAAPLKLFTPAGDGPYSAPVLPTKAKRAKKGKA